MKKYRVYNFTEKKETTFLIDNPFTGEYGEAFDRFLYYYSPDLIAPPPTEKLKLSKTSKRQCRFCFRGFPEVTFRNDAHVLPHLLGNRYLIHDSECDKCNDKFKSYEDSFSKYLGMVRTADVIRGKKGVPTYESPDGKLTIRHEKTENGINYVNVLDSNYGSNKIDENNILLKGIKQTYIPLHVMKSMLKIGYSLLNVDELPNYTPTLRIITSTEFDGKLHNLAQVAKFTVPIMLERPLVVTYKKKQEHANEHIPTKVVNLSFGRYSYQYFLLNADDQFMFKEGEKCSFIQTPPYFNGDQGKLIAERIDFSSPEKRVGEEHALILTFDKR